MTTNRVVFPSFSGGEYTAFEMRQLVSALELRFQALEQEANSFLPSTTVGEGEFAPLVHQHVEADITDLQHVTSIFDVVDVAGTPDPDDVLIWDGAQFMPGPQSVGSLTLNDILNVVVPAPNDDDILQYDDGSGTWIAQPLAGGGVNTLVDLLDTDLTGQAAGDLLFNATGTEWRETGQNFQWIDGSHVQFGNDIGLNWYDLTATSIEFVSLGGETVTGAALTDEFKQRDTGILSTTSTTYVDVDATNRIIDVSALTDGDDYLIFGMTRFSNTTSNAPTGNQVRLTIDGSTELLGAEGDTDESSTDAQFLYAGVQTISSSGNDIRLQYRQASGSFGCQSEDWGGFALNASKLPTGRFFSSEDAVGVTSGVYPTFVNTAASVTVGTGDWLVIVSARYDGGVTTRDHHVAFTDGTTTYELAAQQPTSASNKMCLGGMQILENFSGTLTVNASVEVTAATMDRAFIAAIRIDAFAENYHVLNNSSQSMFGAGDNLILSTSFTATTAGEYIAIGYAKHSHPAGSPSGTQRIDVDINTGGATPVSYSVAADNEDKNLSLGFYVLPTARFTLAVSDSVDVDMFHIPGGNPSGNVVDNCGMIIVQLEASDVIDDTFVLGDPSYNTRVDGLTTNITSAATDIDGTLNVDGNTTLVGTLNGQGAVDFDSTLNVDGATTLNTTLDVVGAVDFDSTLNVDGIADFNANVDINNATLTIAGLTPANNATIAHDDTDFNINLTNTTNFDIRGGTRVLVNDMPVRIDGRSSGAQYGFEVFYDDAAEREVFEVTRETGAAAVFRLAATAAGSMKFIDAQNSGDIYLQMVPGAPGDVRVRDGYEFRIYDGTDLNWVSHQAGATDFSTVFTNQVDWDITGLTGEVFIDADLRTSGDLTVDGTTTTINSNTVSIADNIIILNSDEVGAPTQDAGFEVERGTSANVSFLWNETNDEWTFDNSVRITGAGSYNLYLGNDGGGDSNYLTIGKGFDAASGVEWVRAGNPADVRIEVDASEDLIIALDPNNQLAASSDLFVTHHGATIFDIAGDTGDVTATGDVVTSGRFQMSSAAPLIAWEETDAGADEKLWYLGATGTDQMLFQTRTDAGGTGEAFMTVNRTGTAVTSTEFGGDLWHFNREENSQSILRIGENSTLRGDNQDGVIQIYGEQTGVITVQQISNSGSNWQFNVAANTDVQWAGDTNWDFELRDGGRLRVFDADDSHDFRLRHDGTNAFIDHPTGTPGELRIEDFTALRLRDGADLFINTDDNAATSLSITPAATTAGATTVNATGAINITAAITATSYDGVLAANLLDKTANETITGAYTFTNASPLILESAQPDLFFRETDAPADEGNWILRANGGNFNVSTASDASPTAQVETAIVVSRTGTAVGAVNFGENGHAFVESAQGLVLKGGSADHLYMAFFADAAAQSTRSAFFGFASAGTDNITLQNEQGNGSISLQPAGTGNVTLGNYTLDGDQTVGAGQDNYVLTYDNSAGLISLEAAGAGGGTIGGSIANDQVAVGAATADEIEGSANLTWDGSVFDANGRGQFSSSTGSSAAAATAISIAGSSTGIEIGSYVTLSRLYSNARTALGNNVYSDPTDVVSGQMRYAVTHATYGHTIYEMAQGAHFWYGDSANVTAGTIVTKQLLMDLSEAGDLDVIGDVEAQSLTIVNTNTFQLTNGTETTFDVNAASALNIRGMDENDTGLNLEDGMLLTFEDTAQANPISLRNTGVGGGAAQIEVESATASLGFYFKDGMAIRVYDGANTDYLQISTDTTDVQFSATGVSDGFNFNDTQTKRVTLRDYAVEMETVTVTDANVTVTYSNGNAFELDLEAWTANRTITLSGGPPSGTYGVMELKIQQDGTAARTITWAGGTFRWNGGTAHPLNSTLNGFSIYVFETWDGGTTWYGSGADYS